jgi:hypothetical protein
MSDVLEDAARVIHGPRRQAYGPVEESFDGIATVLNVVLRKKLAVELDGQDVALMMMSLKLCREANEHSWDNLVDLAGYAALKGQLEDAADAKKQVEPVPSPLEQRRKEESDGWHMERCG